MMTFPKSIVTVEELDDVMSTPSDELVASMATLDGPLMIIGASGKMGPSMCRLAARALAAAGNPSDVIAVARFTDDSARQALHGYGVRTIQCDVMQRDQVQQLPNASNIIYMVGRKFGTTDQPALTWAVNTVAPLHVAERFGDATIVALSTGCVYPLTTVASGGSVETDGLTPIGEYANACVARERLLEYCSEQNGTRICLIRLNYALDLKYGVFVDVAQKVFDNQPIDVSMGYVNCIWQRDANDAILRTLDLTTSPARALNLTGTNIIAIRELAERFGERMGRHPSIVGIESEQALLSNAALATKLLGPPATDLDTVIGWTADWISNSRTTMNMPTHFEVSDGKY